MNVGKIRCKEKKKKKKSVPQNAEGKLKRDHFHRGIGFIYKKLNVLLFF